MRARRVAGALVCLLLLSGCANIWNALEAGHTEDTIRALFESHGVRAEALACRMTGTTRDFSCRLTMSRKALDKLISALDLVPGNAQALGMAGACHAQGLPLIASSQGNRPARLGSLEFLSIYLNPATKQLCLQSSHSYG